MIDLVIKRSKWNGNTLKELDVNPYLYNSDTDKMCCLGFLGQLSGFSKEEMDKAHSPVELASLNIENDMINDLCYINQNGFIDNTELCNDLMMINDNDYYMENFYSMEEKEEKLKSLFKQININCIFKD